MTTPPGWGNLPRNGNGVESMATRQAKKAGKRGAIVAVARAPAPPADLEVLDAPLAYAEATFIQGSGNGFTLIFTKPMPAQSQGKFVKEYGVQKPVAVVALSPGTAKDLAVLLGTQIKKHEAEFGEIITPYIKRLRAENASKTKGR